MTETAVTSKTEIQFASLSVGARFVANGLTWTKRPRGVLCGESYNALAEHPENVPIEKASTEDLRKRAVVAKLFFRQ